MTGWSDTRLPPCRPSSPSVRTPPTQVVVDVFGAEPDISILVRSVRNFVRRDEPSRHNARSGGIERARTARVDERRFWRMRRQGRHRCPPVSSNCTLHWRKSERSRDGAALASFELRPPRRRGERVSTRLMRSGSALVRTITGTGIAERRRPTWARDPDEFSRASIGLPRREGSTRSARSADTGHRQQRTESKAYIVARSPPFDRVSMRKHKTPFQVYDRTNGTPREHRDSRGRAARLSGLNCLEPVLVGAAHRRGT